MPSIEKAELKIGAFKLMLEGLEKQHEACKQALFAARGSQSALEVLDQKIQAYVRQGLPKQAQEDGLTDEQLVLITKYCAPIVRMVADTHAFTRANVSEKKGRVATSGDSVEVAKRMIEGEELKITAELRKLEEKRMCPSCKLVELADDEVECSRCFAYIKRWDRQPPQELIEKWKARDEDPG